MRCSDWRKRKTGVFRVAIDATHSDMSVQIKYCWGEHAGEAESYFKNAVVSTILLHAN